MDWERLTEEVEFVYHLKKCERIGYRMPISSSAILFFCWIVSSHTGQPMGWYLDIKSVIWTCQWEWRQEAPRHYWAMAENENKHWPLTQCLIDRFPGKVLITYHGTLHIDDKKQNEDSEGPMLLNPSYLAVLKWGESDLYFLPISSYQTDTRGRAREKICTFSSCKPSQCEVVVVDIYPWKEGTVMNPG